MGDRRGLLSPRLFDSADALLGPPPAAVVRPQANSAAPGDCGLSLALSWT